MDSYITAATKVRALFGGILNENIYNDLISKNSVTEVAEYLKNYTVYKEVLKDVSIRELHRGDLEILLKKQFIMETQRIYKHINTKAVGFFKDLNLDFEIEILKYIVRSFLTEGHYSNAIDEYIFEKGQSFAFGDLSKANDLDEFITKIRKTKIAPYILPLLVEKDPKLIHAIETNLDLYYFRNAYKSSETHLSGDNYTFVQNFLGTKADLYNIELILRAKKYYNWNRESIAPNIIDNYNRVNSTFVYKLADSKDFSECLEILKKSDYEKLAIDNARFDIIIKKYYLSKYIHRIRQSVDFKALLYYFQLKKIDIENIVTITEAVRYQFSKAETKKLIVYK